MSSYSHISWPRSFSMTRGAVSTIDAGIRSSNKSRGSTRWSSTEMIVYERSRGSGSGSNGSAVVRSSFCSAQPWVGSRTSGIAHSPVTSACDFRMPLDSNSSTARSSMVRTGPGLTTNPTNRWFHMSDVRLGIYVPQLAFDYDEMLERARNTEQLG